MDEKLKGRVALVTGSTSGIGKAICERLAGYGAKVIVTGRRDELGERVADGIRDSGGQAAFCRADLESEDDAERLVAFAVETFGGIDVLVNNAGMVPRNPDGSMADGPLHRTAPEYWDQIWRLDLRSVLMVSSLAIPHLLVARQGACIVNIASVHGAHGCGMDVYSAMKGAVIALSRSMAVSYGHRIRVNCISPGMVLVERTRPIVEQNPEMLEQFDRDYLTRMGEPGDIAELCCFLASREGEYVTGANFMLDGGMTIHGAFPTGPQSMRAQYHVGDEEGKSS